MCLLPPTKNKRNRNTPFDFFFLRSRREHKRRSFGLAPESLPSPSWRSNASLFTSPARFFFWFVSETQHSHGALRTLSCKVASPPKGKMQPTYSDWRGRKA